MKDDDPPAFLTITSLQLPDSPIPLIDSQAVAARSCRSRESTCNDYRNDDKDHIMDELLRKVVAVRGQAEGLRSKRNKANNSKCNREFNDLEECTRRIVEGPGYVRKRGTRSSKASTEADPPDCICTEVSENPRINIRKKTEVRRSSRSPSPEVTHIIRIAMKYHGQQEVPCDEEVPDIDPESQKHPEEGPSVEKRDANQTDQKRCPGVNVALDFTLNCSSLQLTSRDVTVKTNKAKDLLHSSTIQPDQSDPGVN